MKILVYGINYYPELTGIGKYSGEMCEWLARQGHEVKVVTAPPYYPNWHIQEGYPRFFYSRETVNDVDIHRCPLYVPRKLSTLKRIAHLVSFSFTSFAKLLTLIKWKPDVTLCIVPTMFCSLTTLAFSKITASKSIIHIQDYELDAMFGLSKHSRETGFFKKIAFKIERKLLCSFDAVSTISHSMIKKAMQKGVDPQKIIFFPNWTDVSHFSRKYQPEIIRKMFNITDKNKIVLYSGNIGEKQGVDIIIDVAKAFSHDNVTFLIVGNGAGKLNLQRLVECNNLNNIKFGDLVSYNMLPDLLASADCHLVIQKKGVADAVLPSKLTNIFAVGGQSVITADVDTELGLLCVKNNGIAVLVEPENAVKLEKGIRQCLSLEKVNHIAIDYAREYLNKDNILNSFLSEIKKL